MCTVRSPANKSNSKPKDDKAFVSFGFQISFRPNYPIDVDNVIEKRLDFKSQPRPTTRKKHIKPFQYSASKYMF